MFYPLDFSTLKTPLASAVNQHLTLYNVWHITDFNRHSEKRKNIGARGSANRLASLQIMETAAENQTPNPILLRVRLVSSMQEPNTSSKMLTASITQRQ
jgi:hypothetical protein